jgi:hypothetical protein
MENMPGLERNLLETEITGNYKQMMQARAKNEGVLELTFEQRMNNALHRYHDLTCFLYQTAREEVQYEGA